MKNQSMSSQLLGLKLRINVLIGLTSVTLPVVLGYLMLGQSNALQITLFLVYFSTVVTLFTVWGTKYNHYSESINA